MNSSSRKVIPTVVTFLVLAGATLFLSPVGIAHAQGHGFRSGSFGHWGDGSRRFHRGAVVPHFGIQQHGFGYWGGHVRSGWARGWGYSGSVYSPYYGSLHSRGPGYYSYPDPIHAYPFYVYPGDHLRGYYFSRYNGFRHYPGGARYYHDHH